MLLLVALLLLQSYDRPDCPDVDSCRQAALEAAARQDYERFHDFAWRAVQKGRPNDADLMYLLARAQSLSGRPGDALVMLARLAARGIQTDAAASEDFRRVRALPGWKALVASTAPAASPEPARSVPPEPARSVPPAPARSVPPAPARSVPPAPAPSVATAPAPSVPTAARAPAVDDANEEGAVHFSAPPFVPAGLAYDGVSRRFIAGDRDGRKLVVIDEPSHHVATLAGANSAGFGEITALEIDRREGDLWVASTEAGSSTLHKLQLVSGRVIDAVTPPRGSGPVRFVDVAVGPKSTIYVLDADGRRLFALGHKSRGLRLVARLDGDDLASAAPAGDGIVYVTSRAGITRVDPAARASARVRAARVLDLSGLTRIRAYRGALVGIQKTRGGARAVSVRLNAAGTRAVSLDVLEPAVSPFGEVTASIAGDVLYYLSGADRDAAVRRITLR